MAQEATSMYAELANLAAEVVAGRSTFDKSRESIPDALWAHPVVVELIDLFEHQPTVGRFLGVSEAEHAAYVADIREKIGELERLGATGAI